MLLSARAALAALAGAEARRWAWWAVGFLVFGGFVLGPAVQKQAFGEWWSGVPYGWDLTDNKTLLAFLAWLPAIIPMWRGRPSRGAILFAAGGHDDRLRHPSQRVGIADQLGEAGVGRRGGVAERAAGPPSKASGSRRAPDLAGPRDRAGVYCGLRCRAAVARRRGSRCCRGLPALSRCRPSRSSCVTNQITRRTRAAARALGVVAFRHLVPTVIGGEAMQIDVRGHRVELQPALGQYAERRFLTALQRFKERVPSVTVRLIRRQRPEARRGQAMPGVRAGAAGEARAH